MMKKTLKCIRRSLPEMARWALGQVGCGVRWELGQVGAGVRWAVGSGERWVR